MFARDRTVLMSCLDQHCFVSDTVPCTVRDCFPETEDLPEVTMAGKVERR